MSSLRHTAHLCELALAAYVLSAVTYTTHRFVIDPLFGHHLPALAFSPARAASSDLHLPAIQYTHPADPQSHAGSPLGPPVNAQQWAFDVELMPSIHSGEGELSWEEETLLSKAFAQAMPPAQIVPYYYRAHGTFDDDDITVTTLVTNDRFAVFARLVETYHGPISVTIHVPSTNSSATAALLNALHALYTSSPTFSLRVDVHLARAAHGRQFNAWRNSARLLARTAYVLALDVDFALCTDVRAAVRQSPAALTALAGGAGALVVPAFEYTDLGEGKEGDAFPRDKQALLELVQQGRIGMFHRSWEAGHNNTDYVRYYTALPGAVYRVTEYQAAYEPYIIFRRDALAWCDERFVGYGANKAACVFELHLAGTALYVLADHFLIHQTHAYAEAARKHERKHNRKIYADFKEEACLRYLKRFRDDGTLQTARGHNVRRECLKYKGIAGLAAEILEGTVNLRG